MRIVAILAALAVPLSTLAADAPRDAVLHAAMKAVGRKAMHDHIAPIITSDATRGGAERFVAEFAEEHYGAAIGGELAADLKAKNTTEHASQLRAEADLRQFERGESYDWDAIAARYPRVRGIVRVSEPAFDSIASHAIVRVDLLTRERATTTVVALEHQPEDSWTTGPTAMGSYDPMHRSDISIHRPAK